jgi:hypothetical protein
MEQHIVTTPGSATTAPVAGAIINSNFDELYGYIAAALPLFIKASGDTTGVTDTAAIQAAFNTIGASNTPTSHYLVFANGDYYVNAKCILTYSAVGSANARFWGMYGNHCRITQVNSNTGIFELQVPPSASNTVYGPFVQDFEFTWSATPLATDTNSVAFGYRSTNSSGSIDSIIFNLEFRHIKVSNCYSAIACTQPAGIMACQTVHIEYVNVNVYSGIVAQLASPTSVGTPNIHIERLTTGQPISGLTAGAVPIVNISACDNVSITNCEFLQVVNQPLIKLNSVATFTISASKSEAGTWDASVSTGTNYILEFQNSYGTITGFCLNGMTVNGGSYIPPVVLGVLAGNSSQNVVCNNFTINIAAGTGTLTFFQDSGSSMALDMPADPNVTSLGTGPAVLRMTNSGSGSAAAQLFFSRNPGGKMPAADQGDTSFVLSTLGPLVMTEVMIWNTPLTANRTINMASSHGSVTADNLWNGAKLKVIRTANATGAYTLTITGIAIPTSLAVPIGGWAEVAYSYALGWIEVGAGSL